MKTLRRLSVLIALLMLCSVVGALVACTPEVEAPHKPVNSYAIVQGYEWGPAVPKVVLEFADNVTGIANDTFSVKFGSAKRTVKAAYVSDENGVKSDVATKYVTIEMEVKYGEASPFSYNMQTSRNTWVEKISFSVTVNEGKSFHVGKYTYVAGEKYSCSVTEANRKVPQTASWVKDTVTDGSITLQRAAWAPEGATTDSGKNPLIIWLHGAGEGGTDIDIDLLGNEVTALTAENETNVQKYFKANGLAGAYVLAVQTPTMWMDRGDGQYNQDGTGKQESKYTAALWKAITTYVEGNSDVDTNRIYIGGCSNGGYMTMNMAIEHGDYFAAFYPICEAYMDSRIPDETIAVLRDYNIWFLQSEDDGTVNPKSTTVPTYFRLLQAGATNCYFTFTENVKGTDDPNASYWGKPAGCYDGHWSWIYAFNDQVTKRFDPTQVTSQAYLTSANCTVEANMWSWIAQQTKA